MVFSKDEREKPQSMGSSGFHADNLNTFHMKAEWIEMKK